MKNYTNINIILCIIICFLLSKALYAEVLEDDIDISPWRINSGTLANSNNSQKDNRDIHLRVSSEANSAMLQQKSPATGNANQSQENHINKILISKLQDQEIIIKQQLGHIEKLQHQIDNIAKQNSALTQKLSSIENKIISNTELITKINNNNKKSVGNNLDDNSEVIEQTNSNKSIDNHAKNNQQLQKKLSKLSVKQIYDNAHKLMKQDKWQEAREHFVYLVTNYPEDDLAINSSYWIGESYYAQGNFNDAANIFRKNYQDYPKSSKAPDSLLKLGFSLANLGKNQDACVVFQSAQQQYQDSLSEKAVKRTKNKIIELGC